MSRLSLSCCAIFVTLCLALSGCNRERARLETRAEGGDIHAMYDLAGYLDVRSEFYNEHGKENLEKAWYWYRNAAERGTTKAMMKMGMRAIAGDDSLFKPKRLEAFSWFERAANGGDFDGQIELYTIYLTGAWEPYGIPPDFEKAKFWEAKVDAQYRSADELRNRAPKP